MKLLRVIALNALLFSATSHAWTWHWTDSDGETHLEMERGMKPCTKMDMPEGSIYKWDPEGSPFCIHLFKDSECKERNGWSCLVWGRRKLGQPWVRSYKVNLMDGDGNEREAPTSTEEETKTEDESATKTTSGERPTSTNSDDDDDDDEDEDESTRNHTSSASTTSPSDPTASSPSGGAITDGSSTTPTSSSAPPAEDSDSGNSLSGGAVAGIVVGCCAGVGIMALFGLLAYRRRRRRNPDHTPGDDHAGAGPRAVEVEGKPNTPPPPPPKNHFSELEASSPTSPEMQQGPPAFASPGAMQGQGQGPQVYASEKGGAGGYPYTAQGQKQHFVELPDTSPLPEMAGSQTHGYQVKV